MNYFVGYIFDWMIILKNKYTEERNIGLAS